MMKYSYGKLVYTKIYFFRKIVFLQNPFLWQIFSHKYFYNKQKSFFRKKNFSSTFEDLLNVFHNLKNIIVQKGFLSKLKNFEKF